MFFIKLGEEEVTLDCQNLWQYLEQTNRPSLILHWLPFSRVSPPLHHCLKNTNVVVDLHLIAICEVIFGKL